MSRVLTVAGLFVPGIRRVQNEKQPYAEAWRRGNDAARRTDGPLWVALGDSLTQGIGASSPERGWVGQVHERLAAAGRDYRIVNLSVTGARVADLLETQLPQLDALEPDLVTVMIGSNDILLRKHRRGLLDRFEAMLARLPHGTVITTLPNPTPTASAVNRAIVAAAAERGFAVAELRDPRTTSWRGKLAADFFHPNDLGYTALADVLTDVIGRAVRLR